MDAILHRVEWPTLLFFAAMFVLMEAVERMGFIAFIGSGTVTIIKGVSKDYRLAFAIIIILWVSALTSAFVESLPVTQMMVSKLLDSHHFYPFVTFAADPSTPRSKLSCHWQQTRSSSCHFNRSCGRLHLDRHWAEMERLWAHQQMSSARVLRNSMATK